MNHENEDSSHIYRLYQNADIACTADSYHTHWQKHRVHFRSLSIISQNQTQETNKIQFIYTESLKCKY